MANTSSAKKATRKIARRTEVNKNRRSRVRSFLRKVEEALAAVGQVDDVGLAGRRGLDPVERGEAGVVGADGARRSAAIDRSEADGMDPGEARDERLAIDLGVAIAVVLGDEELTRLTAVDPIVAAAKDQADQPLTDLEAAGSREVLRAAAKARSISAAGTKRDVALRLLEAGGTAEDLTR